MVSDRCMLIINQLLDEDNKITIDKLAKNFSVCDRTIRYDLDRIDKIIMDYHLSPLIHKPYIKFADEDRTKIVNSIIKELDKKESEGHYCTHEQRVDMIILFLMFAKGYTTIDWFCQQLMASRSTVKKDLEDVKEWLYKRMIFLESKSNWGIKILGNELLIRRASVEFLTKYSDYCNLSQAKRFNVNSNSNSFIKDQIGSLVSYIDMPFLEDCISIIENQLEMIFSDESYLNLALNLVTMILREDKGNKIKIKHSNIKKIMLTRQFTAASNIINMIENHYGLILDIDEIVYITELLLGSNIVKNKYVESEDWCNIEIITSQLIENVSEKLNINLFLDKQLYDGLLAHIGPAVYRVRNELPLKNPLLEEVKSNFSKLYNIVRENSYIIEDYTGKTVTDEEVGYLTMHFGASLERMEQNALYRVNTIIVCNTGIGTAKMLSSKLERMFQINIVDTIAYHQLKKAMKTKNVDLIITTIDINEANIDTIKVSPLLTERDIENIKKYIKISYKPQIRLNNIINIIEKSCEVINREQLCMDLMQYFAPGEALLKGGEQKVLSELLKENTIQLNVDAKDWCEAITKGGQLLYNDGCIEKRYIQAMIDAIEELGPYVVIAPGIAMPHARPESGTKKVGMSLITLKHGVNFGNNDNDPVSIVICLCATDHLAHLKALSQIVKLLEDQKNVQLIKNSTDKKDILKLITSIKD